MNWYLYYMWREITRKTLVLTLIFSQSFPALSQGPRNESVKFKSKKDPNSDLGYLLYKPKNFSKGKASPLLVYLHGSGAAGNNLLMLKESGIPKLIEEGQDYPFIVISPQLRADMNNRWPPDFVKEFITHVSNNYLIDPNRIYLTGFSMGGTGVWEYATAYPNTISCAVPLSGWGNTHEVCRMKNVPTWAFHGAKDDIVSPKGSRNLTTTLKNCGGNVTLTELPNVGHEAWREAYSYPGLINWIAARNKADTVRRKNQIVIDNKTVAYKLPKALYQITGISCSKTGELYGIAAKNSQPLVFNFDTLGHIQRLIRIAGASNLSWQDITHGTNGYFYIADVGNDGSKRKFFQIYKIHETDLATKEQIEAEKIDFTLPEKTSLNFKSIFFLEDFLYLFGETSSKDLYLIRVADLVGSVGTAVVMGSYPNIALNSITSSYYDSDSKSIYLLNKQKIGIVKLTKGIESIKDGLSSVVNLSSESNKEGITKLPNGDLVFVDQNFLGTTDGNLYIIRNK